MFVIHRFFLIKHTVISQETDTVLNKPRAFRGAVKDLLDNGQRMNMKKGVREFIFPVHTNNEHLSHIYRNKQKVWHSLYRNYK